MESDQRYTDAHVEFEFTLEEKEKLEEVLKSLVTSGVLQLTQHSDEVDDSEASGQTKMCTMLAPLTTEVGEVKRLSAVLEKGLNRSLEMLEEGACVDNVLTTTAIIFERYIVDLARFLDPSFPIATDAETPVPRPWWQVLHHAAHDIGPTDGQKRRLKSLHAAYLTLIFTLLAERLFLHENTLKAQGLDGQDLQSSLNLAIKTFDTNWRRLRFDHRVSGESKVPNEALTERVKQKVGLPDMWCAIVQARALLTLALARAALVTSDDRAEDHFLNSLIGSKHKSMNSKRKKYTKNSSAVMQAKAHLAEAKELAAWTWWNKKYCSKKTKDTIETWQNGFLAIYNVVESGILYAAHGTKEYGNDVLLEPVFLGPCQVKLRWDYQCTDLSVAYVYDLAGTD